jgi:Holliday junction resolvasome RuvABC DNA-binding subunit
VEDRRVPGQVVRDAREALTTAGYKVHEARAAVERALAQLDDQVTLPQLIRQALRCCASAQGRA